MTMAKLIITNSNQAGREFALAEHPVIIGRSTACDLVILNPSVSRQHVRAEVRDGNLTLTDLGSHNGIIVNDKSLREAVVPPGATFTLGDVTLEFVLEEPAQDTVVAPSSVPVPEGYELARPSALPAERAVTVDEVFGQHAEQDSGPGAEERAAVSGMRSAIQFMAIIAAIIIFGVIAWNMVGGDTSPQNIKPVVIRAGERVVIDLGKSARTVDGRLVPVIDETESYSQYVYADPDGESVASFELDPTRFMATIEGHNLGSTDIHLTGRAGGTAVVRILVRGEANASDQDNRLSPQERLARGRLFLNAGKTAANAGQLYLAMTKCRDASRTLEPVKETEAIQLRIESDQLYRKLKEQIDKQFDELKTQAVARMHDRDDRGALRMWEQLRQLIPDENDERNQKLKIIYDRTLHKLRKGS